MIYIHSHQEKFIHTVLEWNIYYIYTYFRVYMSQIHFNILWAGYIRRGLSKFQNLHPILLPCLNKICSISVKFWWFSLKFYGGGSVVFHFFLTLVLCDVCVLYFLFCFVCIRYILFCFSLKATTTLTTNDIVINKLTQILSYLRQGRRESKKLKKKEKGGCTLFLRLKEGERWVYSAPQTRRRRKVGVLCSSD